MKVNSKDEYSMLIKNMTHQLRQVSTIAVRKSGLLSLLTVVSSTGDSNSASQQPELTILNSSRFACFKLTYFFHH
jgi:hypothetical protein